MFLKCKYAYLRKERNSNNQTLTSDKIYRFFLKVYPPYFYRNGLGKSRCDKKKYKQIIIRDAGKALHLLFPERFTDLTKVKQRLDPTSYKFIQKPLPLFWCLL